MTTITVYGIPGPQGSKKAVGRRRNGSAILVESSAKVKPWRAAIVEAAREQLGEHEPITGPVMLYAAFTVPRPKRLPKGREWPCVYPDLSKLVRSTEDALTDAGVWIDDGQVVSISAIEGYPGTIGLDRPGAVIQIAPFVQLPGLVEHVEKVA